MSGTLFNQGCYVNTPSTVSESGGYLDLSAIDSPQAYNCPGLTPWTGYMQSHYISGSVDTYQKFSQQYGYFAVRTSLPPTSVPGLQETLWLYPENQELYGPWPDSGEIDFGEFYSLYPKLDVPVIHYPGSDGDPNHTNDSCAIPNSNTAGETHTYALMWTPTTLTTYYDGVPCFTDTYAPYVTYPDSPPAPFNQPFFLVLSQAFGSSSGDQFEPGTTPLPATTHVDWVRVWQYG